METKIKVIKLAPYTRAEVVELENTFESLQKAVDGRLQVHYPCAATRDPICIICNDDGKTKGFPLSRIFRTESGEVYDFMAGTFYLAGTIDPQTGRRDYEELHSLSDTLIDKYIKIYSEPQEL